MSKRMYFPNAKLKVPGLPVFEVTTRNTVYYRDENGSLRKADFIYHKKTGQVSISHAGRCITVVGYDQEKKELVWTEIGVKNEVQE